MTPGPTGSTPLLCLAFILLVPFAIAGLALINTGLGRSRSAAHAMTSSLCVASVAVLVYFAVGFAIQGYHGSPSHTLQWGRESFDWIGAGGFFLRGARFDGSAPSLSVLLGLF